MSWRLRAATSADADALSLLGAATFLSSYFDALDGADIVAHCREHQAAAKFAGWAADPNSRVVLAEHAFGGAPVGYTVLTAPDFPIPTDPAADLELRRIYVLAPLHGQGLGAALIERAIADARAMGKARLLIGVYGRNWRAHRFYEKHGFAVVGERRFRVGAAVHDDLVYGRALQAGASGRFGVTSGPPST